MKRPGRLLTALLLAVCPLLCGASSPGTAKDASPDFCAALGEELGAEQLMVVAAVDTGTAWLSLHERDADGAWTQLVSAPAFIGLGGLGKTREGDGKTPAGTYGFNAAFGTQEDPGCAIAYHRVTEDDYWSGDQRDGFCYNELVSIRDLPELDTSVSEHLCEMLPQYRYALSIDYNAAGEKGKGSAIFLHCMHEAKPFTHGCVAIPEDKMLTVMQTVRPDCVLFIGQLRELSPALWRSWTGAQVSED